MASLPAARGREVRCDARPGARPRARGTSPRNRPAWHGAHRARRRTAAAARRAAAQCEAHTCEKQTCLGSVSPGFEPCAADRGVRCGGLREKHERPVEKSAVPRVVRHVAHRAVAALEQLARQPRVRHQYAVRSRQPDQRRRALKQGVLDELSRELLLGKPRQPVVMQHPPDQPHQRARAREPGKVARVHFFSQGRQKNTPTR